MDEQIFKHDFALIRDATRLDARERRHVIEANIEAFTRSATAVHALMLSAGLPDGAAYRVAMDAQFMCNETARIHADAHRWPQARQLALQDIAWGVYLLELCGRLQDNDRFQTTRLTFIVHGVAYLMERDDPASLASEGYLAFCVADKVSSAAEYLSDFASHPHFVTSEPESLLRADALLKHVGHPLLQELDGQVLSDIRHSGAIQQEEAPSISATLMASDDLAHVSGLSKEEPLTFKSRWVTDRWLEFAARCRQCSGERQFDFEQVKSPRIETSTGSKTIYLAYDLQCNKCGHDMTFFSDVRQYPGVAYLLEHQTTPNRDLLTRKLLYMVPVSIRQSPVSAEYISRLTSTEHPG